MKVEFVSSDPHFKARPVIEDVLRFGTDRLAIVFAFCTNAGVNILEPYSTLFARPSSFAVFSSQKPTDYEALNRIHVKASGNIYVNWGATSPHEVKAWSPIMHSKLIYAQSGDDVKVWIGSHNLTASATQGLNSEAAVLITGKVSDQPIRDALEHALQCKGEALLYDPDEEQPDPFEKTDVLSIYAETDLVLPFDLPWRVQLLLTQPNYDKLLTPTAQVYLHLYRVGDLDLASGRDSAIVPFSVLEGTLTGQNFTQKNPKSLASGTVASWIDADMSIVERFGKLILAGGAIAEPDACTQAVMYINKTAERVVETFTKKPSVKKELLEGDHRRIKPDEDMLRYYRKKDVVSGMLTYTPVIGRGKVVLADRDDLSKLESDLVMERLLFSSADERAIIRVSEKEEVARHPFITRDRFKLREAE